MKTPVLLTAGIALAFVTLLAAGEADSPSSGWALFVAPGIIIFGGFFILFLRFRRLSRPLPAPRLLWAGVLLASVAAWAFYFGCHVPGGSYRVGLEEPPPSYSLWQRPWLIHRIYYGLFRSLGDGGSSFVCSMAVIVISVLLPVLAGHAFRQLRNKRVLPPAT